MLKAWRKCHILCEQTSDSPAFLNATTGLLNQVLNCEQHFFPSFFLFRTWLFYIWINCNQVSKCLLYVQVKVKFPVYLCCLNAVGQPIAWLKFMVSRGLRHRLGVHISTLHYAFAHSDIWQQANSTGSRRAHATLGNITRHLKLSSPFLLSYISIRGRKFKTQ
jgi:hypothetical protein